MADIDLPAICRALGWSPMGASGLHYDHAASYTREPDVDTEDAIAALEATGGTWTMTHVQGVECEAHYRMSLAGYILADGETLCEAACRALTAWARAKEASND